jgi:hypothetical protein
MGNRLRSCNGGRKDTSAGGIEVHHLGPEGLELLQYGKDFVG